MRVIFPHRLGNTEPSVRGRAGRVERAGERGVIMMSSRAVRYPGVALRPTLQDIARGSLEISVVTQRADAWIENLGSS